MDRVRWGPIAAGVAVTLAALTVLALLGLWIGLASFDPKNLATGKVDAGAAIWGIAITLISFIIGGYVAAYSSGVSGVVNGTLNGFIAGVVSVAFIVWLVGMGVGDLLGAVSTSMADVMNVGRNAVGTNVTSAFTAASGNAWIGFIGLGLSLFTAAVGGAVGHREPENLYAPMPSRIYEERRPAA